MVYPSRIPLASVIVHHRRLSLTFSASESIFVGALEPRGRSTCAALDAGTAACSSRFSLSLLTLPAAGTVRDRPGLAQNERERREATDEGTLRWAERALWEWGTDEEDESTSEERRHGREAAKFGGEGGGEATWEGRERGPERRLEAASAESCARSGFHRGALSDARTPEVSASGYGCAGRARRPSR